MKYPVLHIHMLLLLIIFCMYVVSYSAHKEFNAFAVSVVTVPKFLKTVGLGRFWVKKTGFIFGFGCSV